MMAQQSIPSEDIELTHPGGQEYASGLRPFHMCSKCSCGVRTNTEGPLPMVLGMKQDASEHRLHIKYHQVFVPC
jgi:hypothetical protein